MNRDNHISGKSIIIDRLYIDDKQEFLKKNYMNSSWTWALGKSIYILTFGRSQVYKIPC